MIVTFSCIRLCEKELALLQALPYLYSEIPIEKS